MNQFKLEHQGVTVIVPADNLGDIKTELETDTPEIKRNRQIAAYLMKNPGVIVTIEEE